MKRCNYCFRYSPGDPLYCPTCGRSYNSRICSRGHVNSRTTQFCPNCGSQEFSTPAPPETLLAWFSRWVLESFVAAVVAILIVAAVGSIVVSINWGRLVDPFLALLLMLGVLYWTTTLLPGPIKKVGKAAGRMVIKGVKSQRKGH